MPSTRRLSQTVVTAGLALATVVACGAQSNSSSGVRPSASAGSASAGGNSAGPAGAVLGTYMGEYRYHVGDNLVTDLDHHHFELTDLKGRSKGDLGTINGLGRVSYWAAEPEDDAA